MEDRKVEDGEKLAAAHWGYIKSVLTVHRTDTAMLDIIGFHYRTAFIHGFKHGVEEVENAG